MTLHVKPRLMRPLPALPLEIEQEIFEWRAISDPSSITVLMRVSRRVRLWVEPYLYRVIMVGAWPPYSIMKDDILGVTQSKPASFYRDAVRHLYLREVQEPRFSWSPEVLQLCSRTHNLAAAGGSANPTLIPILLQMDLRRLSLSLGELFGGAERIDLKHPLFNYITHLDIFDDIPEADTQIVPHIAALPVLTHLCMNNHVPADILRALLSDCPSLNIFVNLWHWYRTPSGRIQARNPPLRDARFVVGVYRDYAREWEAGARGEEPDFWTIAEDFVAQKRSGAIPESRYWMVDEDEVEPVNEDAEDP
ncbi:hypothetical protein DFH07DRAFT_963905 [Mycena maculata]|uniref:Uncharacterized protein n=1 Tax=Mycena maculata TaxID=230809 RepID=A0AAD7IKT2_9AGAR|nr:hypothetical protein DFH07DRAFT_963905 [Mycena maculata]